MHLRFTCFVFHEKTIWPHDPRPSAITEQRSGGSKGWSGGTPFVPSELWPPCGPYKIGCKCFKIARLHNIQSVKSHRWCQITPLTQSYTMSSGILAPKRRCGHPTGHPKLLQLETPLEQRTNISAKRKTEIVGSLSELPRSHRYGMTSRYGTDGQTDSSKTSTYRCCGRLANDRRIKQRSA